MPSRTAAQLEQEPETRRVREILDRLREHFPDAVCALDHRSAFELLVATILSAQCTDQRVNLVTPELFRRFPDARSLAGAAVEELEELVRTTGFFRNKARNLKGAAARMVEAFGAEVPATMDELLTLPGVARKTANVVLGTWFRKSTGVVVDTHVSRISQRLGLTDQDDPVRIEQDLMATLPESEWIDFSHRVIHHGRKTCKARKPDCPGCFLVDICPTGAAAGREG